jgi:acetylornithine deacetylase/succinyl-diaminopimelate desuccinylase-like protein
LESEHYYLDKTSRKSLSSLNNSRKGKKMSDYAIFYKYLDEHLDGSIAELSKLVAQPSVAAQNWGVRECAQLVAVMLGERGFAVEIMNTDGAPVVYGERPGKSEKTLLIYNHYDVQPAEPLDLWESPPFEPEIRDGKLYGRGVSDDKGQLVARLFALDAILNTEGELPCRIKFIIEGAEEISSVHLHEFIQSHKQRLAADACIWEFGGVDHREVPIQYLGLRGICYVQLEVKTADIDVHSGLGGSIFPNPAWRLVWALSTLKGPDERIRIPGFYDSVLPPSERDRRYMELLPEVSQEYKQQYGVLNISQGFNRWSRAEAGGSI